MREQLKFIKIADEKSGETKSGGTWAKLIAIFTNGEEYNSLRAIEVFGEEKVENFKKTIKEGNDYNVDFNIVVREWEGRYFTDLQLWRIFDVDENEGTMNNETTKQVEVETDDLPF